MNECAGCLYICMHAVPCVSSMAGMWMWQTHVSIIVHCVPCIRTLAWPNTSAIRQMDIIEWMEYCRQLPHGGHVWDVCCASRPMHAMDSGVVPPHDCNTCTLILFKDVNWLYSVTHIVPPFCHTQYAKDQRLRIQARHIWSYYHTNPTREEDHTCTGQGFTTVSSTITHCIPFKEKDLVSWRTRVQLWWWWFLHPPSASQAIQDIRKGGYAHSWGFWLTGQVLSDTERISPGVSGSKAQYSHRTSPTWGFTLNLFVLTLPSIVRHTSMSGLLWAQLLVWALLYFRSQGTTIPSCADVEWTFLWPVRPSDTWIDLRSESLSG